MLTDKQLSTKRHSAQENLTEKQPHALIASETWPDEEEEGDKLETQEDKKK